MRILTPSSAHIARKHALRTPLIESYKVHCSSSVNVDPKTENDAVGHVPAGTDDAIPLTAAMIGASPIAAMYPVAASPTDS
jgi:hypothetical protein